MANSRSNKKTALFIGRNWREFILMVFLTDFIITYLFIFANKIKRVYTSLRGLALQVKL